MFWLGVQHPNIPFPMSLAGPHNFTCQMASKSVKQF